MDDRKKYNRAELLSGSVFHVCGEGTENAVRDYQRANGLKVDGIVGPMTRARIKELVK